MKMRTFTAPTLLEVMTRVRAEMGPDYVILSTHEEDGVVEVRAAVERSAPNPKFAAPNFMDRRAATPLTPSYTAPPTSGDRPRDSSYDPLAAAIEAQGATEGFAQVVADAGRRLAGSFDQSAPLVAGLEGALQFAPIQPRPTRSILLIGPPGSGKTTAAAKLSMRLSDQDDSLEAVCADFDAAGGATRLAALMRKPYLTAALTPDSLERIVRERDAANQRIVVDGPPFNPFDPADMERLGALCARVNLEPVLVLSAEGHPLDLEEAAKNFAKIGVRRAIITKLDAVRRRGGAISAISSARLSIAQLGLTPNASGGLVPATASRIAKLLLDQVPEAELLKGAA